MTEAIEKLKKKTQKKPDKLLQMTEIRYNIFTIFTTTYELHVRDATCCQLIKNYVDFSVNH